jgi:transcriptional regulator with XRE-family HTH domain
MVPFGPRMAHKGSTTGALLKAKRLDQGLSLAAAAQAMGVSRMTLRRAETLGRRPGPVTAHRIATHYGYRVTELWPLENTDGEAAA